MTTETVTEKNDRDIFWIASTATALALGTVFASNQAVSRDANGFVFHVSAFTFLAFAIGAAIGFAYWKIVAMNRGGKTSPLLRVASFVLLLIGIGAFLSPLRFLPTDQFPDVAKGLGMDVVVLSLLGLLMWRVFTYFNNDEGQADANKPASPPDSKAK
jgi:ABC-type dipeptide/oligopeptide/nickel transport system permease component